MTTLSVFRMSLLNEAFDYAKVNYRWQKPTISDSFENDLLPQFLGNLNRLW